MTTIKIIVIVIGLVGIVPQGDNDGMTVLLRDAMLAKTQVSLGTEEDCDVDMHVPLILQLAGGCEGDCTSFNLPTASGSALVARIAGQTIPATAVAALNDGLLWLPMRESLRFDAVTPALDPAPHYLEHSYRLGGGGARVNPDCLEDVEECPIIARLTVSTGGVRACSLAVNGSPSKNAGRNAGFVLAPFEDQVPMASTGRPLAEAHSIEIDTNRSAPLILTATNFGGHRLLRRAKLTPDADNQIVLLVSNLPLKRLGPVEASQATDPCSAVTRNRGTGCSGLQPGVSHSATLYDLLDSDWGAESRIVPHFVCTSSAPDLKISGGCVVPSGAVNEKLAAVEDLLEYPSSPADCKPGGVINP